MRRLPFTTGSLMMAAAALISWQFESGRFGVGERPTFATVVPRDVTPAPDVATTIAPAVDASSVSLRLSSVPTLGQVGLDQPCPVGIDDALGGGELAPLTTCAVHVDLDGLFATTRAPGRFQVWCQDADLSFRPANVVDRDVRVVGSAVWDYRTVLVIEVASPGPAELPTFAALRRDPSARGGLGAGCPSVQDLGTGLRIDRELLDPYRPEPDGVLLLLSGGGVAVRPSSVGVELVRLTSEVPVESPESAAGDDGGGE